MSRLDPRYFSPAQVFAQFSSSGKNEGAAVGKTECKNDGSTPNNRREIQITETGEVSLPPDKARVSVVCSNAKETVEEVKTSVNRRMDYVLQVLRSHHVQDFTIHRMLNRTDKLYQMEVEVVVEFSDFSKCEQVCNLLVEKLDDTVKVSVPVMFHTVGRLDTLRRQACLCAVRNAKNKALEVVQMFNQSLGPPILIREENYEEFFGPSHELPTSNKTEELTFQQKVAMATVTVSVKIFVIFEIREKVKTRKRN